MSAASATLTAENVLWKPKVNPWAIGAAVSLAAFVEVLDTSIANVALPYIAGDLGASYDDSTWVLTSYLAANAIILPMSGWLAGVIGRKRYFIISLSLFALSSFLCGLAPSLPLLLFFRVLQGVGGGGMQPMAQAILNDSFPPEKRGQAFALYGITAVLAPTVGPMLGGFITDNYSWRWIFFINLPVSALAMYLTWVLVEDPPFLHRIKNAGIRVDFIGIGFWRWEWDRSRLFWTKGRKTTGSGRISF
jgi:DHA2 family multidrug resistance protein